MEVVQIDKESFNKLMQKIDEMYQYLFERPIVRSAIELLTVREAAESLGVSESTIYRSIRKGVISKDVNGKLLPLDIDDALLSKSIKCDARYAEEFRRTYIYK